MARTENIGDMGKRRMFVLKIRLGEDQSWPK